MNHSRSTAGPGVGVQRANRHPLRFASVLALLLVALGVHGQAAADTTDTQDSPSPATAGTPRPTAAQRATVGGPGERLGGASVSARGFSGRGHVVVVEDAPALEAAIAAIGIAPTDVWSTALFGFAADLSGDQVAVLRSVAGVVAVEPDRPMHAFEDQATPPWGLDRIDQRNLPIDSHYGYLRTGAGVNAYVIDSGLWMSHREFAGRIAPGAFWDFGDGTEAWDCSGHGTHVAGTIGGTTYGVAKQVTIIPVKVLDCAGVGPLAAIAAGIDWVAGHHSAGVPAVANLSLGSAATDDSVVVDAAVEGLIADGVTVVVAAGNDAADSCSYSPARVTGAITVAASDDTDDDFEFSNFGACNDLFAPGVEIVSAAPSETNDGSAVKSGTSMAAPHVAGAAALVLQHTSMSPAEVWAALDAASTKGVLSECCGDPDKLLFVDPTAVAPPPPPALTPLVPARLLETRPGLATEDGLFAGVGRVPAGATLTLPVTNRAGVPVDATAVMLNVTAVAPIGGGFLTVFPCGEPRPLASNVNYVAGDVVPNAVLSRIGAGGSVCIFTMAETDVVVDVNGYVPAGGTPSSMVPARLLDTRPDGVTVDGQSAAVGWLPAGETGALEVTGRAGVPDDATAVILNVTAVAHAGSGFLTVYPCGEPQPLASNVNYVAGDVVPNAVLARVGAGGFVCIFTMADTDLVVDVNGYVPAGGTPRPLVPGRLLDTRPGSPTVDGMMAGVGRVPPTGTVVLPVLNRAGVPGDANAVLLNVTAVSPGDSGFLTVFPCGGPQPLASNVNYLAGDVVPNAVLAKVGVGGSVCIFTMAETDIVVDVNGYV